MKQIGSQGFTLVEQLIVVSLFIVLIGGVGGIYFTFLRQHRAQLNEQALQKDLLTFFEVIDREVRTGFGAEFGPANTDSATEFYLKNQNAACVKYGLGSGANAGRLLRAVSATAGCTPSGLDVNDTTISQPLTSRNTFIRRLTFRQIKTPTVTTTGSGSILTGAQGRVTVVLRACPTVTAPDVECIDLQTTMTSRQYGGAS